MADCNDHLQTYHSASLNGAAFTATGLSDEFGRRGPSHEYPDRDTPAAEDLGRKQRRYSVSGYVAGSDHVAQAKRLVAAAERVSPARLTHPIWGTLVVKIDSMTVRHNVEDMQRRSEITIEAVEFGGLSFPSIVAAIGSLVQSIIGTLSTSVSAAFDTGFAVSTLSVGGALITNAAISDAAEAIRDEFASTINWTPDTIDIYQDLSAAIDAPENYTGTVDQLILAAVATLAEQSRTAEAALAATEALLSYGAGSLSAANAAGDAAAADNVNLITAAVRSAAAVYTTVAAANAVRESLNIQTSALPVTIEVSSASLQTSADVIALLVRIRAKLAEEIAIAQQRCDYALARALTSVRCKVSEELSQLAFTLPARVTTDICLSLPSLVAAHRATGDARRVLEIERANPSRSTWFMPTRIESRSLV